MVLFSICKPSFFVSVPQGRAAQLEAQLREKEQEIVRLRIALEATDIKAEDDTVRSTTTCVLGAYC